VRLINQPILLMKNILFAILIIMLVGCNNNNKTESSGFSFKGLFTESDSLKVVKKDLYYSKLSAKYADFNAVQGWFLSRPKEVFGQKGQYYKMLSSEITDGNSISHKNLADISERGTYLYLFVTDDAYYIFDLFVDGMLVTCRSVRRISSGFGKEPVYDLKFDVKGNLLEEIYQAEVSQDLYESDDKLYFEFSQKGENIDVKNVISLGDEKDFDE